MASVVNIVMDQGSDFEFPFDVSDDDGIALDMSSHTIRAQMRRHSESANSISFSTAAYANGTVKLSMTAAQTANVESGYYLYDVEAVSTANVVSRLIQGKVRVTPEITR